PQENPRADVACKNPTGEEARRSTEQGLQRVEHEREQNERGRHEREMDRLSRAERAERLERVLAREVPIIVFANEFFDALPVEILSEKGSLRIASRDGRFVEEWAMPSVEEMEFLDRHGVHPEGDVRIEV